MNFEGYRVAQLKNRWKCFIARFCRTELGHSGAQGRENKGVCVTAVQGESSNSNYFLIFCHSA